MSTDTPLFMVRARFDHLRLLRFARAIGLPLPMVDDGYVMHAALRALFADSAPQPFAAQSGGAHSALLGYCSADNGELLDRARAAADPIAFSALDADSLCSKRMPDDWRPGAVYRFETRVCPVARLKAASGQKRGTEMDLFLNRCLRAGDGNPVDRESVYREWLAAELSRDGAARLRDSRMIRFQRVRLSRRDRGAAARRFARCERPDATIAGSLEVVDPDAFAVLLRRGLGRHRAFGFGMLLLRH